MNFYSTRGNSLLQKLLFLVVLFLGLYGAITAQTLAQNAAGTTPEIVTVEKNPTFLNWEILKANLRYPDDCFDLEMEGAITFKILIGLDGKVDQVDIPPGVHPSFQAVIQTTMKELKASPGIYQGEPIPTWMPMEVVFDYKAEKKRRKNE